MFQNKVLKDIFYSEASYQQISYNSLPTNSIIKVVYLV